MAVTPVSSRTPTFCVRLGVKRVGSRPPSATKIHQPVANRSASTRLHQRWQNVSVVSTKATAGDGGDDNRDDSAGSSGEKPIDARAALLAKAAAYKKQAEEDSKAKGGRQELEMVVSEALRKVEAGGSTSTDDDSTKVKNDSGQFQQRQVTVKIMTRKDDYNPFDEDEQVVGFEDKGRTFTPTTGGADWKNSDKSAFSAMLDGGRRRERGVGVDNDVEEVLTRTTFDDERYNKKKVTIDRIDTESKKNSDASDATQSEDPTAAYQPKVSTWGVFPRPDNISTAYGGGRSIKAGEFKMETDEEKEQRRARVKLKLRKYREDAGIDVDNATRRRWNMALQECQGLMRLGKNAEGADLLRSIVLVDEINPRTQLGGEITFHYGMCLDNTQRRDEALEMYKRCVGNPHGRVSKLADRMIWGMTTASTKMKADQFDYDTIKDKYDPFLIQMTTERQDWKMQQADPEEEERLKKLTIGAILGVLAIPLALGAFIASR